MQEITLKTPAKVNIFLRVIRKRPDGYHDLQMVMLPLSLYDEIQLKLRPAGIDITVDGISDKGMAGEKNLAYRAAKIISEKTGKKLGVRIELTKNIPVAAGLGGGSSDAAAVLKGLNELWELGLATDKLAELGKTLGADVPFFCHNGPAFVEGIGDRVTVYDSFPNLSFLLINPGFSVSTSWIYKQWDLQLTLHTPDARVRPLFQVFSDVIASLHNDLERVTISAHPEIETIKTALKDAGAKGVLMSGSGPTVFGVFAEKASRDAAREHINDKKWRVFSAEGLAAECKS
ncbi:MAG: 4-(cytidine 5'-diphospho)-2-C-methyl-D-erythritol kinase [Pseudomonadota bacterium]